jgi:transcriptional regulator with GAF, ATPase, and Fis domain
MRTLADLRKSQKEELITLLYEALDSNSWNLTYAAKDLDVGVSHVAWMIKRYGLTDEYLEEHHRGPGKPRQPIAEKI